MKKLIIAGIVAAGFGGAPAFAADLPVKAPAYVAPTPMFSWTGFYFGGEVGARFANNDWTTSNIFPSLGINQAVTSGSMDNAALRLGAYLGYNWQFAPTWIVGIEGDAGWANNTKTVSPAPGTSGLNGNGCGGGVCTGLPSATAKELWDGSVRARLGMLFTPNTLVFGTAGAAWQSVKLAASCPTSGGPNDFCFVPEGESHSTTKTGWTVGGGVEQRISGNWLARIDYRYADFGTLNQQFFNHFGPSFDDRFTANVKVRTNALNFGLAYKF